ncbi:MAG: hypothetical protein K2M93_07205 [Muribaculaceae bacterium]|nr:hypothetical protein [Muribaculaceae bacterium]
MTHTGFFERYFITPIFRKYADFSGSESDRNALVSAAAWLIVTSGVIGVLLGLIGLLGPDTGFVCLGVIGGIWIVGSICPLAALASRAMHGGKDDKKMPVHFLGIDKFLAVTCGLFLILGILMTVTTLNSGTINPYHRGQGDRSRNPLLEQEEVVEEPIFNYQTADPAPVEEIEEVETEAPADTITIDDAFDPTIATEIELDTLAIE